MNKITFFTFLLLGFAACKEATNSTVSDGDRADYIATNVGDKATPPDNSNISDSIFHRSYENEGYKIQFRTYETANVPASVFEKRGDFRPYQSTAEENDRDCYTLKLTSGKPIKFCDLLTKVRWNPTTLM